MIVELFLLILGIILVIDGVLSKIANADTLIVRTLVILGVLNIIASTIVYALK